MGETAEVLPIFVLDYDGPVGKGTLSKQAALSLLARKRKFHNLDASSMILL